MRDDVEIPYFPADLKVLESVEVVYVTMKGWKAKTSDCKVYAHIYSKRRSFDFCRFSALHTFPHHHFLLSSISYFHNIHESRATVNP
jgi:hypothetical protein